MSSDNYFMTLFHPNFTQSDFLNIYNKIFESCTSQTSENLIVHGKKEYKQIVSKIVFFFDNIFTIEFGQIDTDKIETNTLEILKSKIETMITFLTRMTNTCQYITRYYIKTNQTDMNGHIDSLTQIFFALCWEKYIKNIDQQLLIELFRETIEEFPDSKEEIPKQNSEFKRPKLKKINGIPVIEFDSNNNKKKHNPKIPPLLFYYKILSHTDNLKKYQELINIIIKPYDEKPIGERLIFYNRLVKTPSNIGTSESDSLNSNFYSIGYPETISILRSKLSNPPISAILDVLFHKNILLSNLIVSLRYETDFIRSLLKTDINIFEKILTGVYRDVERSAQIIGNFSKTNYLDSNKKSLSSNPDSNSNDDNINKKIFINFLILNFINKSYFDSPYFTKAIKKYLKNEIEENQQFIQFVSLVVEDVLLSLGEIGTCDLNPDLFNKTLVTNSQSNLGNCGNISNPSNNISHTKIFEQYNTDKKTSMSDITDGLKIFSSDVNILSNSGNLFLQSKHMKGLYFTKLHDFFFTLTEILSILLKEFPSLSKSITLVLVKNIVLYKLTVNKARLFAELLYRETGDFMFCLGLVDYMADQYSSRNMNLKDYNNLSDYKIMFCDCFSVNTLQNRNSRIFNKSLSPFTTTELPLNHLVSSKTNEFDLLIKENHELKYNFDLSEMEVEIDDLKVYGSVAIISVLLDVVDWIFGKQTDLEMETLSFNSKNTGTKEKYIDELIKHGIISIQDHSDINTKKSKKLTSKMAGSVLVTLNTGNFNVFSAKLIQKPLITQSKDQSIIPPLDLLKCKIMKMAKKEKRIKIVNFSEEEIAAVKILSENGYLEMDDANIRYVP